MNAIAGLNEFPFGQGNAHPGELFQPARLTGEEVPLAPLFLAVGSMK
jgi:hypothetical protein